MGRFITKEVKLLYDKFPEFKELVDDFFIDNNYITYGAFSLFIFDLITLHFTKEIKTPRFSGDYNINIADRFTGEKAVDIIKRSLRFCEELLKLNDPALYQLVLLTIFEKVYDNPNGKIVARNYLSHKAFDVFINQDN